MQVFRFVTYPVPGWLVDVAGKGVTMLGFRGEKGNDGCGQFPTPGKPARYNLDHRITGSPDHRITGSPDHRITGSPDHRITGSPDHRISLCLATANLLLGLRGHRNGVSPHSVSSGGRRNCSNGDIANGYWFRYDDARVFFPFAMSHVRQGLLNLRPHNQKVTVRSQGENDGLGELTTTGKPMYYNPEHRNTGTPEHRNTGTPEHRNTGAACAWPRRICCSAWC